jgi:hypothetical protein
MGAVQEVLHEPFKQDTCKPNGAQINNWNKVLWLLDKPFAPLVAPGWVAQRAGSSKKKKRHSTGTALRL